MGPTISVLIPNHNKAPYLSFCIQSVLSQTYPPKEILIDDFGSTDESRPIIKSLQEKYELIKACFYRNKPIHKARNLLLEKASGDYVVFLDSDDFFYDKNVLANLIRSVSANCIPFGRYVMLESDDVPIDTCAVSESTILSRKKGDAAKVLALQEMQRYPRCALFNKRYIIGVGGYTRKTFEDVDLILKLILAGYQFVGINITASVYRGGARNRLSQRHAKWAEKILKDMKKDYLPVFTLEERCSFFKYPDPIALVRVRPRFRDWLTTKSFIRKPLNALLKRKHQANSCKKHK